MRRRQIGDSSSATSPAVTAARLSGLMGGLATFCAGLWLAGTLPDVRGFTVGVMLILAIPLMILAGGVTLLAVAGPIRRQSHSWTIVTLLLAIGLACFFWYGVTLNSINFVRYPMNRFAPGVLVPSLVLVLLALIATLLAIYCVRSLRLPDRPSARGFEPVVAEPVEAQQHL